MTEFQIICRTLKRENIQLYNAMAFYFNTLTLPKDTILLTDDMDIFFYNIFKNNDENWNCNILEKIYLARYYYAPRKLAYSGCLEHILKHHNLFNIDENKTKLIINKLLNNLFNKPAYFSIGKN